MEEIFFCTDYKMNTEVVWDHATGDIICTECALVLESHYIDETPEWRTFTDDSKDNDPIRVGETTVFSTLMGNGALSTVISAPKGAKTDSLKPSIALNRIKSVGSNSEKSLVSGFSTIANMAERLGLVTTIKYRASELYKKVENQKRNGRGRKQDSVLAACLHLACSQENKPRTIKEICSATNGVTMKEFHQAKNHLLKQLEVDMNPVTMVPRSAGDFLRRFCSYLGMNNRSIKAAEETIQMLSEIDIRRNPTSIAAGVIYIISQLSEEKTPIPLREIATATGVAEGTIKNAYKDLHPHISKIIPTWFANENLKKGCLSKWSADS